MLCNEWLGHLAHQPPEAKLMLSFGRSETFKNCSRRAKARLGSGWLNLVRKSSFRSFKGFNDSALLTSLNILSKSQSSNNSRMGLACLEPFLTVSDRPGDTN